MPKPPLDIRVGDIVQMRKPHPCGGNTWQVVRIGAEIGIRCQTCNRKVLLLRSDFERRVRRVVEHASSKDDSFFGG
ncbi:MAG: DUF951 domain-containing protein [Roseiflexus sp.]